MKFPVTIVTITLKRTVFRLAAGDRKARTIKRALLNALTLVVGAIIT